MKNIEQYLIDMANRKEFSNMEINQLEKRIQNKFRKKYKVNEYLSISLLAFSLIVFSINFLTILPNRNSERRITDTIGLIDAEIKDDLNMSIEFNQFEEDLEYLSNIYE